MMDITPHSYFTYQSGEDRNVYANTHLSRDRCQNEAAVFWINLGCETPTFVGVFYYTFNRLKEITNL
jgi:hypothetical protein